MPGRGLLAEAEASGEHGGSRHCEQEDYLRAPPEPPLPTGSEHSGAHERRYHPVAHSVSRIELALAMVLKVGRKSLSIEFGEHRESGGQSFEHAMGMIGRATTVVGRNRRPRLHLARECIARSVCEVVPDFGLAFRRDPYAGLRLSGCVEQCLGGTPPPAAGTAIPERNQDIGAP